MKLKLLPLVSIVAMFICNSYGQTKDPTALKRLEIGDDLVDITFSHRSNFPSWLNSTKDLKGKLVLLDFWGLGCVSCVESFPKMDSLQKEFGDKFQIILVNSSSSEEKCLDYISKLRDEKLKLAFASLPSISGDKRWGELFPHDGVPHHVWIDQEGKVMGITQGWNATRKHIKEILGGAKIKFLLKDDLVEYDYRKYGIMKPGHKKLPSPILYSAFLPPFNGLGGGTYEYIDSTDMAYKVLHRNLSAAQLYALSHKKLRCIVETSRIAKMGVSKGEDEWQEQNSFTYEIKIPLSEKQNYAKYMLEDLNRFFGMKYNVTGNIETRTVPSFVLKKIRAKSALKRSNAPKPNANIEEVHITTLTGLKAHFRTYENIEQNKILVDETAISPKEKLDVYLPKEITNLKLMNEFLNSYGLEISKEFREIELMVIKDK